MDCMRGVVHVRAYATAKSNCKWLQLQLFATILTKSSKVAFLIRASRRVGRVPLAPSLAL